MLTESVRVSEVVSEVLRLTRDGDAFRQEVEALPKGHWVVVDEVQRLPALLNDVQDIISRHPSRYRFALTGSSAEFWLTLQARYDLWHARKARKDPLEPLRART